MANFSQNLSSWANAPFGTQPFVGGGIKPYTRTITYPGGVNPNYRRPSVATGGAGGGGGKMSAAALAAIREAKAHYEPDGGYGKGVEAGLERERTQAMSSGMQHLVGSGLAGTTMAGGLGKKFSEEVGMPTRARIEETRAEKLSAINMFVAQLAEATSEAQKQRIMQEFMARLSSETSLATGRLGAETSLATSQIGAGTQLAATGMQQAGALERLIIELAAKKKDPFTPSTTTFVDETSPFPAIAGPMGKAADAYSDYKGPVEDMYTTTPPSGGTFDWDLSEVQTPQQVGMTGAMRRLPGQGYGATGSW